MTVRVVVIGNHRHHHCSEAQWARAFAKNGCDVMPMQVEDVAADPAQAMGVLRQQDLVTYTRTHSRQMHLDQSWCDRWVELERAGVQTIGLHLDRFWGLERERLIADGDAQFRVGTFWSADGGSDEKWRAAGVQHEWLVPAADEEDALTLGTYDPTAAYDVVFVGSGQYHPEYPARDELLAHLRKTYGRRFAHYGHGGDHPAVRGPALRNVYVSAKVVVGDSAFANQLGPARNYHSDRVPITLSHRGFLIHPWMPGLSPWPYKTGRHFVTHVPGDWDDLDAQIGAYLASPGEREGIAQQGREWVLAAHTWRHRIAHILCVHGLGDCDQNEAAA